MRSEGMAKEMPAATLSVLMPMTSPSWVGGDQSRRSLWDQAAVPSMAEHHVRGSRAELAVSPCLGSSWSTPEASIWVRDPQL